MKINLITLSATVVMTTIVLMSACSSTSTVSASPSNNSSNKITTIDSQTSTGIASLDAFLYKFEQATMSHSASDIMRYMDKDYKKEQFEKLLKNNTDSFLNKFYSDNQTTLKGFKIQYKNISKITRLSALLFPNYYTIKYKIEAGKESIELTLTILFKFESGEIKYSIYGPVG